MIDLPGPAWPVDELPAEQRASIDELVALGYANLFESDGVRYVVLTQDAADLFRRVPDESGGLKDPEVSRRPCLGQSAPGGNLDYLDALVADGRVGGIFRHARKLARHG